MVKRDDCLSSNDYRNMLKLIDQISVPAEQFRTQVQLSLSNIFGYDHSVFWVSDKNGNLYHPNLYNIKHNLMYDYLNEYYELDYLHPKKHLHKLSNQQVFCMDEVVPFKQYETTEYYNSFMKKYNYYHEMVVNFTYGSKLIGTLGLVRPKHQNKFDETDVKRFQVISKYISQKIYHQSLLENMQYQNRLLEAHSNMSPIGLIILNSTYQIIYYNQSAKEICSDLLSREQQRTLEYFVDKWLVKNDSLKLGLVKTVVSPTLHQYTIHIVPEINMKSVFHKEPFYLIHFIPENQMTPSLSSDQNTLSLLTSRESEICQLLRIGYTNYEISKKLFISMNTVKRHIQNIYKKMQVKTRASLLYKLDRFINH